MSSSRAENGLYGRLCHPYASLTENGLYHMFRYPYLSQTENGLYDRFRHPFLYIIFPYPLPQSNWKRSVYVSLPLPQSKWEWSMTDVSTPTTVEMKKSLYDRFRHPYPIGTENHTHWVEWESDIVFDRLKIHP